MREIKFRAWDILGKRMVKWEDMYGLERTDSNTIGIHLPPGDHNYLFPEDVILEQYTGYKDKNNKEIYEGDIIKYNNKIYWIGFSEGCFDCRIKLTDTNGDELFLFDHKCIEIIGNISENPELLEAK